MTQFCMGGGWSGRPEQRPYHNLLNKNLPQTIPSNTCIPIIVIFYHTKELFQKVLLYLKFCHLTMLHVYILNLDLNVPKKNRSSYKTHPSRTSCDTENVAEKIIHNMIPKQLIEVACNAFHQGQQLFSTSSYRSISLSVSVSIALALHVSVAVSFVYILLPL